MRYLVGRVARFSIEIYLSIEAESTDSRYFSIMNIYFLRLFSEILDYFDSFHP